MPMTKPIGKAIGAPLPGVIINLLFGDNASPSVAVNPYFCVTFLRPQYKLLP